MLPEPHAHGVVAKSWQSLYASPYRLCFGCCSTKSTTTTKATTTTGLLGAFFAIITGGRM